MATGDCREDAMPNVNCLQYAALGNGNNTIPDGVWTSDGWITYASSAPGGGLRDKNWSALPDALRALCMASTPWGKAPDSYSKTKLHAYGVGLLEALTNRDGIVFTRQHPGYPQKIPATDGIIVMGMYEKGGGVHYFTRNAGKWVGVPNMNDPYVYGVLAAPRQFTQTTASGSKKGAVLGWFL
jgi:hypothetical protein